MIKGKPKLKRESIIQKEILKYLREELGIFCWKHNNMCIVGSGVIVPVGLKGVSDIIGCIKSGKILAIEVKSAIGVPSKEQVDFLKKIKDNNGISFIARSISDVDKNLKKQFL
jgi:hypothetical protein